MQNCPSCQSDQFKKASLIHAEGISVGAAVGVGAGGVAGGVGGSTSILAAKCAPPTKDKNAYMNRIGSWILLVFFVPLMIATFAASSFSEVGLFWKVWAGLGVAIAAWSGAKFEKAADASYRQATADYEKTYMCLRCGTFYKPFD